MRFSIIIPTYNVSEYISETLNSILNQEYKDFEIVIVDDKSTDNTIEIVKEIMLNNKGYDIKLIINKENRRQGYSRNKALDNASGEYVFFLDSDDLIFDNTVLKRLNNIIDAKKTDIIYTGFKSFGDDFKNIEEIPNLQNCDKKYRLSEYVYTNIFSICWNLKFINDNNIRFPEDILWEDVYFYFKGIYLANTFEISDIVSHKYRLRLDSSTWDRNFNQAKDVIILIEKCVN